MKTQTDIVFNIIQQMLANSPERSYKRLNPALRSTLSNCIEADLPFLKDTFSRIYNELRGGWWFGDGAGSATGEHFYTAACICNNASAQQSFESYAGRSGVLWEDDAASPTRLYVGSEFTWNGKRVTVTSLRSDSLVACSYKGYRSNVSGVNPGAVIYGDGPMLIISSKKDGAATIVRLTKAPDGHNSREVSRRFTIKYCDIKEFRKTARGRVNSMVNKIAKCDPAKDIPRLTKEINGTHFRHFELETINAAFHRRKELMAQQDKITSWRNGKGDCWLGSDLILLRLKDDQVECSNGNSVSIGSAKVALPILIAHRKMNARLTVPLDGHTVSRVGSDGVTIGCTVVPWEEIDHITPKLQTV